MVGEDGGMLPIELEKIVEKFVNEHNLESSVQNLYLVLEEFFNGKKTLQEKGLVF